MPQLKFKRLKPEADIPVRATDGAAGFDLIAISMDADPRRYTAFYTGLAVAIPKGYVGLLFPRSSIRDKNLTLANCVGVIDSDYRGEIVVSMKLDGMGAAIRHGKGHLHNVNLYNVGDRVAQLVIVPLGEFEVVDATDLDDTERGAGGHGSTGA